MLNKTGLLYSALPLLIVLCSCSSEKSREVEENTGTSGKAETSVQNKNLQNKNLNAAKHSQRLALLEKMECQRCHQGLGLSKLPLQKQCVGCHQQISEGTFDAPKEAVQEWQESLHSLPHAPDLSNLGKRLQRSWIEEQLRHPHDSRPGLAATMPRLPLSKTEIRDIAEYLVPEESEYRFNPQKAMRGKELVAHFRCTRCHALGEENPGGRPEEGRGKVLAGVLSEQRSDSSTGRLGTEAGTASESIGDFALSERALALAPNLSYVSRRFQSGQLVPWLMNPQAFLPNTEMPNFSLTAEQAESIASYLWHLPSPVKKEKQAPQFLPVLKRRVSWEEVNEKVFRRSCWHCHSDPQLAKGDGGPGNTGGFGYKGRKLDFSSYQSLRSGSVGANGKRRSIFVASADTPPVARDKSVAGNESILHDSILIQRLRRRQWEEIGVYDDIEGMPLGLPALSAEQIQLVESWIAQGRPRRLGE